ncbi:hypothetical protein H5123_19980 [Shewanella sp. SR43-4]|uniref:hypothetical protein n=1 Tax=Shewanella sp. SR43-4 TaxID=2760942 RepID=UPI0015F9069A|nr:hypothetical protein [Shewanella sp. SR43-4]MBB1319903.1 hypothetical protein [Shewanella sp. SR43-4]
MKSEAELMAELKQLQAELSLLMDLPANSPEARAWAKRVLEIKESLEIKKH